MDKLLGRLQTALANRYSPERECGRGGMAIVFLAHDLKHRRRVALKVLRPELAQAIGAERFLREIQIAAQLTHPNILPVYDSDQADGLLYHVMPYVQGESLRDRLNREKQLPVDDVLAIVREVADALSHAHRAGVIHCDIKPENILFVAGHAVVSDFGIARAIDAAGTERITETGLVVGTPLYMSPEQAARGGTLDGRSDIYSLGCLAYEMLGGQPPFTGPTAQAILARHSLDPVPPLRTLRPSLPEGLERSIGRALAKVPADRFATAAEFAEAMTHPAAVRVPARSVAVLPFLNLSGDPENEYFADGITEDVIAQLSKIRALKVISRTSVMPFKKREQSLREISVQLGVAALLEGSVRRARDRVRIVAQLIDAETHQHLWAETYDREFNDIFAIQSDVALRIAAALEAELSPDERARLLEHATASRSPDLEAYEAYLKGRFHWYQHTPENLETALRYFKLALQKDPNYALAHGAIADTWGARTFVGLVAPREAYPGVKAGVLKAMELDDTASETHDLMGRLKLWYEWDWEGAERAFQRAIQLNANYADVRVFYAWFLTAMQRWDEARTQIDRALELDPLNAFFQCGLGLGLFLQGRHDDAIHQFRQALQLEPSILLAHAGLWSSFHHKNMREEALAKARTYFEALADREVTDALTRGAAQGGYAGAMRCAAEDLAARFSNLYVPPTRVARLYAYANERNAALQWLETAYAERDFEMVYLSVQPAWENLRSEPRFQELLRRMAFST